MKKKEYIWDKPRLIQALQPRKLTDVLYEMRLTPSQMQTWWSAQPDVGKMVKLREVTGLNPLDFVKRV